MNLKVSTLSIVRNFDTDLLLFSSQTTDVEISNN